jgi:hypothetical protein
MATVGTCSYCGETAMRTCQMCGKALCKDHADDNNPHVCVSCAGGGQIDSGDFDDVNTF